MRPQVSHEANETPCQTVDSKIHRQTYNAAMEHYRIVQGVGLYYVTFTVVEWLPVFIDEPACKIITDSFNFCIENRLSGNFRGRYPDLGVRACVRTLSPPNLVHFTAKSGEP